MRFLTPAVAAVVLLAAQAGPGIAQTATVPTTMPPQTMPPAAMPPAAPPPAAASPGTSVPETTVPPAEPAPSHAPKPHKPRHAGKRMTMHQRFAAANTAQDGHLTLDQARAGKWAYAVRNFSAIDREHKGYITESDIHAFAHARYLARHAASATPAAPAAPPPAPAQ